jgi:hypothetical protein
MGENSPAIVFNNIARFEGCCCRRVEHERQHRSRQETSVVWLRPERYRFLACQIRKN